jgi:hypothetical protein
MKKLLIFLPFIMIGCTSISAEYNGMEVNYNRFGSRNIKQIEFEAAENTLKAKVKGVEDSEGVSQNLSNIVKILEAAQ